MQQLCEEVLCTLNWAHAREVYERHVNPMGPSKSCGLLKRKYTCLGSVEGVRVG